MARESETIEVLYSIVDKKGTYSKLAGTSICSMFENTEEKVRVHIFHDGSIEGKNKENFLKLAFNYGQEIIFYNVRQLLPDVWNEAEKIMSEAVTNTRFTEASLYRLLASMVLPDNISRLIYLDADTLIHMDIKELWNEPIGSNGMSAVFESDILLAYDMCITEYKEGAKKLQAYWKSLGVEVGDGFNAGVLLMDLRLVRLKGNILIDGLRVALNCEAEDIFYDQDILLFYFAQDAHHLPWRYNMLQHWEKKYHPEPRELRGIYHYINYSLGMDEDDVRDTIYYDYFMKTPWSSGRFFCKVHRKIKEVHMRRLEYYLERMNVLLASLLMKKLVIASSNAYEERIKHIMMEIGELSKISSKSNFCNLGEDDKLKIVLHYDVDECFYLFFVDDYARLKVILEQSGLPEKDHYMDGRFLLEKDEIKKHVGIRRYFGMSFGGL